MRCESSGGRTARSAPRLLPHILDSQLVVRPGRLFIGSRDGPLVDRLILVRLLQFIRRTIIAVALGKCGGCGKRGQDQQKPGHKRLKHCPYLLVVSYLYGTAGASKERWGSSQAFCDPDHIAIDRPVDREPS